MYVPGTYVDIRMYKPSIHRAYIILTYIITHADIPTYIHKYKHTYIYTYKQTYIHAFI